jgi:hypothetical protein
MATNGIIETEYFNGLAKLIYHPSHTDDRGDLIPIYFDQMPFTPCRSFVITNVPAGTVRGRHSHRIGMQMLMCLNGCIEILMRHQGEHATLILEPLSVSLVFGAGVWCQQKYLVEGSVLLGFSSEPYDSQSYVEC